MIRAIVSISQNRGYRYAIGLSLIWHLFWLFLIQINIDTPINSTNRNMQISFVGAVLSDDAFNLIVSSKPELSQSIYKPSKELTQNLEPESAAMDRRMPGDLVSVSVGRSTWTSFNGIAASQKPYVNQEFYDRFSVNFSQSPFPINGELASRGILKLPSKPELPSDMRDTAIKNGQAEYEIEVDAKGDVVQVINKLSSGSPEIDFLWQNYLNDWQFLPLKGAVQVNQKGIIALQFDLGLKLDAITVALEEKINV